MEFIGKITVEYKITAPTQGQAEEELLDLIIEKPIEKTYWYIFKREVIKND